MALRLQNVKISTLLISACAAFVLVISGIAIASGFMATQAKRSIQSMYQERLLPLKRLKGLADLYGDLVFQANQVALGRQAPEQVKDKVGKDVADIQKTWDSLVTPAESSANPEEFKKALTQVERLKPAITELVDALDKKDRMRTSLVVVDLNDLVNAIGKEINAIELVKLDQANAESSAAQASIDTGLHSFIVLVIAALGVSVGGAWFLIRQITQPIRRAVGIAQRVATGDMEEAIEVAGTNEMSEMLHALQSMQISLRQVVRNVRNGADHLANAALEIALGNTNLSDRTEQQASTLEETSASMVEVNSQVRHNADSASQANQLALNASNVAVRGGEVVGRVVQTMKEINDSSKKISDIISVIDGIAFQTNILALNAAVEAARAGEQGRGFAVVASEVRALAGRSAEAAKEIKRLINASVERVDQGSVLVDEAGTTMSEVVTSIRRVTDLVGEISASSNDQALGVTQIGQAIQQMDQVTQQNAALVEQMAAAAGSLRSQADELVKTVAVFKINANDPSATSPILENTQLQQFTLLNA